MKIRTYSELLRFETYEERLEYLRTRSKIGDMTFSGHRYLNQSFYRSKEWRSFRRKIILRDHGCDLGIPELQISGNIIIHHLNPIGIEDLIERTDALTDPENVICVSDLTHRLIHYGTDDGISVSKLMLAERRPNDTSPWRD